MTQPVKLQYFEIYRAIYKGAMSLWLNRRTLMPMTLVPIIVTFLTLMVMRANFPEGVEPSAFIMALMQIPADFVTGIFCSLIIFIIMNAPKKGDKDAPVMFSLNIMARKDLLLAGAVAHVAFAYFAGGAVGLMQMIFEPIQAAAKSEEAPNMLYTIALFGIVGFLFYAIRFVVLPILIIGKIDIRHFFARNRKAGFSIPVFAVKLAVSGLATIFIMLISTLIYGMSGDSQPLNPTQMALSDIVVAFGSVISTAWAYAALSIGIRQMMEGQSA